MIDFVARFKRHVRIGGRGLLKAFRMARGGL